MAELFWGFSLRPFITLIFIIKVSLSLFIRKEKIPFTLFNTIPLVK